MSLLLPYIYIYICKYIYNWVQQCNIWIKQNKNICFLGLKQNDFVNKKNAFFLNTEIYSIFPFFLSFIPIALVLNIYSRNKLPHFYQKNKTKQGQSLKVFWKRINQEAASLSHSPKRLLCCLSNHADLHDLTVFFLKNNLNLKSLKKTESIN